MGARFRGTAAQEGVETSDGRLIGANETTWRELPLSLMVMTQSSHGGMPTTVTEVAGRIDLIERRPATGLTAAEGESGTFDVYFEGELNDDDVATTTAANIGNGSLRGVSIDFGADEEIVVLEEDEDGWPTDYLIRYTNVEIMAATVCPTPAFAGAYIELVDPPAEAEGDVAASGGVTLDLDAMRALAFGRRIDCGPCGSERAEELVAAGGPVAPPAAWFDDPQLPGPTPLHIEDDGRVYGHLATWGECHVGIDGACVTPPHSRTNYARFRVASTHTAEGSRIPTGTLFMGTTHPSVRGGLSLSAVQEHYADTGQATADVAAGEDAHGIWVAGAMRPGLTPEQIRAARGSVLSGDWRNHAGQPELCAALHVNVPGFPIPHAELAASGGRPVALVAAGARAIGVLTAQARRSPFDDLDSRLDAAVTRALAPLLEPAARQRRAAAADRLRAVRQSGADRAREEAHERLLAAGYRHALLSHDPAATERLMTYWSEGPGAAKIRWGVSGDFDRCTANLDKYVGPGIVKGLCSNLHKRATGVRPGQE